MILYNKKATQMSRFFYTLIPKKSSNSRLLVSILRNTHCMPYGLIVILPPHNNQTE